ncbi:hypothetical protein BDU57DRAFT_510133 [Ampelomyces quisqualis]|uniref:Uncharacterized protein n=1 Tax=Ampelomyces quisqualis TaxID=50730 RepID=A0A6A5R122_AMPQU|nr:hypothetical protein BDU57DRAFT_510133 [Ampelomyces quisqualis]
MSCFKLPDNAEPLPDFQLDEDRLQHAWQQLRNTNCRRILVGEYRNFLGFHVQATPTVGYQEPHLSEIQDDQSYSVPGKVWLPAVPICYRGGALHWTEEQSRGAVISQYWPTADPYQYIPVSLHDVGVEELGLVTIPDLQPGDVDLAHLQPCDGRTFRAVQTRQHWALCQHGGTSYQVSPQRNGYVQKCEVFVETPRGWVTFPPFAFTMADFSQKKEVIVIE